MQVAHPRHRAGACTLNAVGLKDRHAPPFGRFPGGRFVSREKIHSSVYLDGRKIHRRYTEIYLCGFRAEAVYLHTKIHGFQVEAVYLHTKIHGFRVEAVYLHGPRKLRRYTSKIHRRKGIMVYL